MKIFWLRGIFFRTHIKSGIIENSLNMRTLKDYAEMENIAKINSRIAVLERQIAEETRELTVAKKRKHEETGECSSTSDVILTTPPISPAGKDMKLAMEMYEDESAPKLPRKEEEEELLFPELKEPLQQYFETFTGVATATTQTGKQRRSTTIKDFVTNEFRSQEKIIKEIDTKLDQFIERERSLRHKRESAEKTQQRQIDAQNEVVVSKLITLSNQITALQKTADAQLQLIRRK